MPTPSPFSGILSESTKEEGEGEDGGAEPRDSRPVYPFACGRVGFPPFTRLEHSIPGSLLVQPALAGCLLDHLKCDGKKRPRKPSSAGGGRRRWQPAAETEKTQRGKKDRAVVEG